MEDRARLTALVADLNELPERQRGALVMRELSGLSHGEIAAALGVSVPAAKQAIFDARTGLQEFAKGRAMDCAEVRRIVCERDGRMLRGRPLRAHLRACESCRALRDAIGVRRADLAALPLRCRSRPRPACSRGSSAAATAAPPAARRPASPRTPQRRADRQGARRRRRRRDGRDRHLARRAPRGCPRPEPSGPLRAGHAG